MQRAKKLQKSGRARDALAMFKLALEKKPEDNAAQLGVAWSALDVGKSALAADTFREVLARDATVAEAQFGLGEALRAAGRTSEAVAAFERYLELAPEGPDAATARNAIDALK